MQDQFYPVHNAGFVRLVDTMGNDSSIVEAARISYGEGTTSKSSDRGLIRYLMNHRHTTPFEMVEFKLHIACPIFVMRQWIRHRTASVNEYSGRYSEMPCNGFIMQTPWMHQSQVNAQGRADEIGFDHRADASITAGLAQAASQDAYEELLSVGISREQARIILPLTTYTQFYWKIDLHNLLHFLSLRMDSHAQKEIRDMAFIVGNLVKFHCPVAWEAFVDYRMNAITLSGQEIEFYRDADSELSNREAVSFANKIDAAGLPIHPNFQLPELPNPITSDEAYNRMFVKLEDGVGPV